MALRPITEEELNKISGQTPTTPVPTSTGTFHPSFSSLRIENPSNVKGAVPKVEQTPEKTFGQKLSSGIQKVFPGQKVGQAIGTLGGYLKTPQSQRQNYDLSAPTPGQVVADVAQGALTIGTGGVAKPTTAISRVAGLGSQKLAQATIPTATTAGKRILQNTAIGAGFGGSGAIAEGEDVRGVAKSTLIGAGAGLGLGLAGEGISAVGKLKPKPEEIMNRVARLTPSDARKFEQLAGKSHGQYLKETGNFGSPEQIIENEAKKFVTSVKDVDEALASLPGQFKARPIKTALDELVEREIRVSAPGAPSKDLERAVTLQNKYNTTGLTMSEINEAKRLYERNVKLEFNKLTSPEGVARSTNIDRALRAWQLDEAKKLGFKNLDVLNKQTQLSKFIVDKLGKQLTGKSGNEAVNLTDWIVLSGGDPTAVSAFLAKRVFSNKGVQARVAKTLTKNIPQGQIKAEFGGKTGLPALIPGRDYSIPKPNNPKYQTIKLPESVRETNLGLDEVKNTIRSKPVVLPQLKKSVGKSYKDSKLPKLGKVKEVINKDSVGKDGIAKINKLSVLKKLKKDFSSEAGFIATGYKETGNLTTKILKDLEGKTTVSKQYILDATNRGELKQVERDLIRNVLETEKGDTINVADFAKKVKSELLPLKVKGSDLYTPEGKGKDAFKMVEEGNFTPKYENVSLPDDIRGNVAHYKENIYESPVATSAGDVHFNYHTKNYFGHTRIEDMADNKTRRVIEVQSDLYQKGNLEKEFVKEISVGENVEYNGKKYVVVPEMTRYPEVAIKSIEDGSIVKVDRYNLTRPETKLKLNKLQQYNDPTAHFRMIREEIKKASQDGKTKLQFPTGETAMKIEGLGTQGDGGMMFAYNGFPIEPQQLKVGRTIYSEASDQDWVITETLGNGKFRAIPKELADQTNPEALASTGRAQGEMFDISGEIDTNNPIYKFYEKDVQKYLNKFGGKRIVDDKGVSWIEVPIKKEYGDQAVEAFGKIGISPLFLGSGIGVAGTTIASKIQKNKQKKQTPQDSVSKTYQIPDRSITISDSDIQQAAPVLFGEVSNRTPDKMELEMRVILNTALNRVAEYKKRGKDITLAEVLAQPNQYQAYGGKQYQEYSKPISDIPTQKKKKEVNIILQKLISEIEKGVFKDNTNGAVFYKHLSDGRIIYDNSKSLFK